MTATRAEVTEAARLLLCLPGLAPSAHRTLVAALGYEGAVRAVRSGDARVLGECLGDGALGASLARSRDRWPEVEIAAQGLERAMQRAGSSLWLPGDPRWDDCFGDVPSPPVVLHVRGDLAALDHPRAAIVGTRSATPAGREMARRLGGELSDAGVSVVSGLALGIDAQAHAGVLASATASPVGVVGCGLDVVYPPQHGELWRRVSEAGALVSEYPPGTRPTAYSFPARNRIIAALAQVVVVVESAVSGGSLITATDAQRLGRTVMAVPGNPCHPSCAGSNALLRSGHGERPVFACLETNDVLSMLMLDAARSALRPDPRPSPSIPGQLMLELLGCDELTTSQLLDRAQRPAAGVARDLDDLETAGWIECLNGRWSRVGTPRRWP